jgi:hypothetical protein
MYLLFKMRAAAMLALLSEADDNDPLAVAICCTRPARLRITLALESFDQRWLANTAIWRQTPRKFTFNASCFLSRLNMARVDNKLRNKGSVEVQRTQSPRSLSLDCLNCLYDDSAPAAVLRLLTN